MSGGFCITEVMNSISTEGSESIVFMRNSLFSVNVFYK
jgi:hypothetical protein